MKTELWDVKTEAPTVLAWGVLGLGACAERESGYFQEHLNEVTSDMVVKRYGPSHEVEQREGDRTV